MDECYYCDKEAITQCQYCHAEMCEEHGIRAEWKGDGNIYHICIACYEEFRQQFSMPEPPF